jgi:uncharacterized protein YegP (UPF0339 family)
MSPKTGTSKMADYTFEVYRDKAGKHRWRCFSPANKKQVGKSTEAFSSSANAKNNARINGYRE